MVIKTLRSNKLYKIIWGVLSSALLLVTIKAEMRSHSELLKVAPTPRVAKRGVLDGYPLSRFRLIKSRLEHPFCNQAPTALHHFLVYPCPVKFVPTDSRHWLIAAYADMYAQLHRTEFCHQFARL